MIKSLMDYVFIPYQLYARSRFINNNLFQYRITLPLGYI